MGAQISSSPPNAPPALGPRALVHPHMQQSFRFLLRMPVPPGGRRGQKGGEAGAGQARTARGGSLASCQQTRETGRRMPVSSGAAARPCSRRPHRGATLHRRPQEVRVTSPSHRAVRGILSNNVPRGRRRPHGQRRLHRGPRVARKGPEKASLQTQREISGGRGQSGQRVTASGHQLSFWGDRRVLK